MSKGLRSLICRYGNDQGHGHQGERQFLGHQSPYGRRYCEYASVPERHRGGGRLECMQPCPCRRGQAGMESTGPVPPEWRQHHRESRDQNTKSKETSLN